MKNLNIRKTAAIAGIVGVSLLTPFSKSSADAAINSHEHLYLNIGDKTIVFKECEGYVIAHRKSDHGNTIDCTIYYNDSDYGMAFSANTNDVAIFEVYDEKQIDYIDEFLESSENTKTYKLNK